MLISTWNVNSVRQRTEHLLRYLKEVEPDVLCLQEIKCQEETFPRMEVESAGYNVAVHGQKTFNGVAILSRLPLEDVTRGLPGDPEDVQSRYIEAVVSVPTGVLRVGGLYLPNGNPLGSEKFPYKLRWMQRLEAHAAERLLLEESFLLFTFWDYQAGCWQRNEGIRIDHILLSPQATDRFAGVGIDKYVRGWDKPSDHVPVWVELNV